MDLGSLNNILSFNSISPLMGAYLNLLYRRKADMVESADERASYQKQADELVDKVKEIKQKRAEQPPQTS